MNLAELIAQIAAAPAGTAYTIGIGANFLVTTWISIPANKNITLVSEGETKLLQRAPAFIGTMVNVVGTLSISELVLDGNKSAVTGGNRIIDVASTGTLHILTGAVLQNNDNSIADGGGVYVATNGSVTMSGGLITGNNARSRGGGVFSAGPFTMTGGEIRANTSANGGGLAFAAGGLFHMLDGLITDNHATSNGGGVYLIGSNPMTLDGGAIVQNHAVEQGGGVSVRQTLFTMNDGLIADNTAYYGGGVVAEPYASSAFTLNGGLIARNQATTAEHLGGISLGGGVMNMYVFTQNGGTITENSATRGGGVLTTQGSTTLTGGVIAYNVALEDGGGILASQTLTVTNASITGNTAALGGGIALYGASGTVSLTDTRVTYNTATRGGGIYVTPGHTLTLSGAAMLIADNTATSPDACDTGGGIYANPRTSTIVNPGVIFTRNYAAHAFGLPLGTDQPSYDSVVHEPSLDPQYHYAWNNADINWCPLESPTMQITYHRNSAPGDPLTMTYGSDLLDGAALPMIPPPWDDSAEGELNFAGWSLIPNDTCPHLTRPMPTTYHAADFTAGAPANLDVYAIWCPEPIYHTVTFDAHGGTPVDPQSILGGDTATYAASTRAGCLFDGWYTNEDYDVRFNFATPLYEDLTLHARWICPGSPEYAAHYASLTPEQRAELAELEALLAALEQGEKCYNIGILTEYGYQLVEHNGTIYLHNELTEQHYLAILPLTIAEVEADIERLAGN
jgi:uncharacterized repeat protein (TIGR02543 family)